MNALQLLVYQAPLSAMMLLVVIPFFEPVYGKGSILDPARTFAEFVMVFVSGVNAFAVNLSVYWVIGKTSALTYNMVGNMKFVLTIMFGAIIFNERINQNQMVCILAILVGLTFYSYFRIKEIETDKSYKLPVAIVVEETEKISPPILLNEEKK